MAGSSNVRFGVRGGREPSASKVTIQSPINWRQFDFFIVLRPCAALFRDTPVDAMFVLENKTRSNLSGWNQNGTSDTAALRLHTRLSQPRLYRVGPLGLLFLEQTATRGGQQCAGRQCHGHDEFTRAKHCVALSV